MPNPVNPIKRVNKLYANCLAILEREVTHLYNLNTVHKLEAGAARDLVAYIKLLGDMKTAQAAIENEKKAKKAAKTKTLTDEQIEAALISAPSQPKE